MEERKTTMFKSGDRIKIPLYCPKTEEVHGLSRKPDKKSLLGQTVIIDRIESDKIVVGGGWFFHPDDFLTSNDSPPAPTIPIQIFDPENLSL